MALKLQELHPALVHLPIALMPVSLIADTLGRMMDNDTLCDLGRNTMPIAAVSNVAAAAAGLIAQEAVKVEGKTDEDLLITHRTLNAAALGVTAVMAVRRLQTRRPGLGYLAMGFATLGVVTYSAYLGSKMVYTRGMGVEKADGLRPGAAPEMRLRNVGEVGRVAAGHLRDGVKNTMADTSDGRLIPRLRRDVKKTMNGELHEEEDVMLDDRLPPTPLAE